VAQATVFVSSGVRQKDHSIDSAKEMSTYLDRQSNQVMASMVSPVPFFYTARTCARFLYQDTTPKRTTRSKFSLVKADLHSMFIPHFFSICQ
jgi:hypothetical protein